VRTVTAARARSGAPRRGARAQEEYLRGRKADDTQELPLSAFHLITELPTGLLLDVPNAQENSSFGLYAGRFGLLSSGLKGIYRRRGGKEVRA
jgi:hypothetical protein